MATLSDDTLRKVICKTLHSEVCIDGILLHFQILVQIQQTAVQSQRALNASRSQTAAKEKERRIVQLTLAEISELENDVNLYKGVGKM